MRQELNSPKIYLITKNDRFYNIKEKHWYSSVLNATFDKNSTTMSQLLEFPRYEGCKLYVMTEFELMQEMASQTTNIVIAGEYFHRLLFKLASKIPTISQVNKVMSMKCKSAIEVLTPFSKMHQEFLKEEEERTDDVQGHYSEYILEVSNVEIYEMAEVSALIKAYHKDKKSMLGITKKVLDK